MVHFGREALVHFRLLVDTKVAAENARRAKMRAAAETAARKQEGEELTPAKEVYAQRLAKKKDEKKKRREKRDSRNQDTGLHYHKKTGAETTRKRGINPNPSSTPTIIASTATPTPIPNLYDGAKAAEWAKNNAYSTQKELSCTEGDDNTQCTCFAASALNAGFGKNIITPGPYN